MADVNSISDSQIEIPSTPKPDKEKKDIFESTTPLTTPASKLQRKSVERRSSGSTSTTKKNKSKDERKKKAERMTISLEKLSRSVSEKDPEKYNLLAKETQDTLNDLCDSFRDQEGYDSQKLQSLKDELNDAIRTGKSTINLRSTKSPYKNAFEKAKMTTAQKLASLLSENKKSDSEIQEVQAFATLVNKLEATEQNYQLVEGDASEYWKAKFLASEQKYSTLRSYLGRKIYIFFINLSF